MKALKVLKYVGFGILGLGFITLAVFITMSLWNALIPALFHGPVLTFWQTAGLFILSKILLTGVAPGRHDRRKKDWDYKNWRNYYKDRYRNGCCDEAKEVNPEQV
jgi:membrane protein implicated in regulation of membrane protease activity